MSYEARGRSIEELAVPKHPFESEQVGDLSLERKRQSLIQFGKKAGAPGMGLSANDSILNAKRKSSKKQPISNAWV